MIRGEKKVYQILKLIFFVNILIIVGITLYMLQMKGPDFGKNTESNVILERYSIIITLIAIPAALKLFPVLIDKKKDLPEDRFLKSYFWIYILRMAILDIVAALNIIGFFIYESSNFLYLTVIIMFALCFVFPSKYILPADDEN